MDHIVLVDPGSDGETEQLHQTQWPAQLVSLQGRYDNQHFPRDPLVAAVFRSPLSTMPSGFCRSQGSQTSLMSGSNADHPVLEGWIIYTDGAGPTDRRKTGGWGVAIWEAPILGPAPQVELFGPVPCVGIRWLGAEVASNNIRELTAMAEALIWFDKEARATLASLLPFALCLRDNYRRSQCNC